jgi:AcrR family transcriptional regulator
MTEQMLSELICEYTLQSTGSPTTRTARRGSHDTDQAPRPGTGDEDPAAPQRVAGSPAEQHQPNASVYAFTTHSRFDPEKPSAVWMCGRATATRLFTELGYDATSLQMIADEKGLTKAAVYYHFRAKTDILHAAMLPGMQQLGALLDEAAAIRGRRARIEYLVNGITDFLVENRHYAAMASTDPAAKRDKLDEQAMALRRHALTLLFGDNPTGAERLAFNAVYLLPDCLPDLTDLTDPELREALRTTMLRILRVPSGVQGSAAGARPVSPGSTGSSRPAPEGMWARCRLDRSASWSVARAGR